MCAHSITCPSTSTGARSWRCSVPTGHGLGDGARGDRHAGAAGLGRSGLGCRELALAAGEHDRMSGWPARLGAAVSERWGHDGVVSTSDRDAVPGAGGPAWDAANRRATDDELTRVVASWRSARQRIIAVLVTVFVLAPVITQAWQQGFTGTVIFLLPATLAFVAVVCRGLFSARLATPDLPRGLFWFAVIIGLGGVIFAVSGMNELTALAVAAAAGGNRVGSFRLAAAGIAACCALGLAIGLWRGFGYGNTLTAAAVPALG